MSKRDDVPVEAITRRDAVRLMVAGGVTVATISSGGEVRGATVLAQPAPRQELMIDQDWRFFLGDPLDASSVSYDDSAWETVELPHDWGTNDLPGGSTDDSITADPARFSSAVGPTQIGPFEYVDANDNQNAVEAWTLRGVGWYRKTFTVDGQTSGQRIEVRFDGIEQNADIYFNGVHLGFHPYGYTSFTFDLTPYVTAGGGNVLAVRVNTSGFPSRWYAGSGVYRHVWLTRRAATSMPANALYVTTPSISSHQAGVTVAVTIEGQGGKSQVDLVLDVLDPSGAVAAHARQTVRVASGTNTVSVQALVAKPKLWDLETPNLYVATVTLLHGSVAVDRVSTSFGIRSVTVDVTNGFQLNGRTIKLEGGCVHSTNGFLGARAIDRADIRRVELLKAAGFNAVRTAHNPPSPAFLDACDQLGLLVYEDAFDTWDQAKEPQDYSNYFAQDALSDLTSMIVRDRNHPSVVIWSLGNEIADVGTQGGISIGATLYNLVKSLDPTRPVVNSGGQQFDGSLQAGDWSYVDLGDYHYNNTAYPAAHAAHPTKPLLSSEGYPYDLYNNWAALQSAPYVVGDFVWTAMDYVGESGIGWNGLQAAGLPVIDPNLLKPGSWCCLGPLGFYHSYPWFVSGCGDIDLIGTRKPQNFYRAVVAGRSAIEMFVMRPTPSGTSQQIGVWGWPDELDLARAGGQQPSGKRLHACGPGRPVPQRHPRTDGQSDERRRISGAVQRDLRGGRAEGDCLQEWSGDRDAGPGDGRSGGEARIDG